MGSIEDEERSLSRKSFGRLSHGLAAIPVLPVRLKPRTSWTKSFDCESVKRCGIVKTERNGCARLCPALDAEGFSFHLLYYWSSFVWLLKSLKFPEEMAEKQ
jgi:hypothetical protein